MRCVLALMIVLPLTGCSSSATEPTEIPTPEPPAIPPVPDVQCAPPTQEQSDTASEPFFLGRWIGKARFHDSEEFWVEGSYLQIDPLGMDSLHVTIGGAGGFDLNFYCVADQGEWGSTWLNCDDHDSIVYGWSVELAFSTSAAVGFGYQNFPTFSQQLGRESVTGTWCRYGIILAP